MDRTHFWARNLLTVWSFEKVWFLEFVNYSILKIKLIIQLSKRSHLHDMIYIKIIIEFCKQKKLQIFTKLCNKSEFSASTNN